VAGGTDSIAPQVARRLRHPIPPGLGVLPESLPVVSFGDPTRANVATLSLNPSWIEFQSQNGGGSSATRAGSRRSARWAWTEPTS
jgi:hypothetical protein